VGNGDSGAGDQADGLVGIDAFASDIGIGDAGQPGDLGRDRHAGVLEPLPGLADLDDHAACIEGNPLDRQVDDRVISIEADGLDIDDRGRTHLPLRLRDGIGPGRGQCPQQPVVGVCVEQGSCMLECGCFIAHGQQSLPWL